MLDYKKEDINVYITLLSSPILLSIYWYFGRAQAFSVYFINLSDRGVAGFYAVLLQFLAFFILFFIIPAIFVKRIFNRRLRDFGLGVGDYKFGLRLIAIVIPVIIVPIIYAASKGADIRSEYPLFRMLYLHKDLTIWYELSYILLYYTAWEFYFRGFLIFSLIGRFGAVNAILIQTISSCLIHLGKPAGETFGSIIAGIAFGIITVRTGSIWYAFIMHVFIGVLTDIFIVF